MKPPLLAVLAVLCLVAFAYAQYGQATPTPRPQRRQPARAAPSPSTSPTPDLNATSIGLGLFFLGIWIVGILLYFLPTFLAWGKDNWVAIFALNFLAGWTFIGWIVALVWALTKDKPSPPPYYPPHQ